MNIVGGVLKEEPTQTFGDKGAPAYNGYETDFSFDRQSSAGLQAMYPLDLQNSITMQVFAEGAENQYDANVKWLYLTHLASDNSTFRIGRIGSPIYYYSDFLNVGYAYHWVTPPSDVYNYDTTITGIDYIYQDVYQDHDWSLELLYGSQDQHVPSTGADIRFRNALGFVFSVTHNNWLTLRASVFQMDTDIDVETLDSETLIEAGFDSAVSRGLLNQDTADAFQPIWGPQMAPLIDDVLLMEDERVHYAELAVRAEKGRWFGMAEWTRFRTDTYLYNWLDSWYVTGGIKVGAVVYHLTYARYDQYLDDDALADYESTLPNPASEDDIVNYFARQIRAAPAIAFASQWNTVTAGVSIDASTNTALKFEVLHFDNDPTTPTEDTGVGHNMLFRTALNVTF